MIINDHVFLIKRIYWERIFLHFEITTTYHGEVFFYLLNDDKAAVPMEFVDFYHTNGKISFSVNIAAVKGRCFLENGRWKLMAKTVDETGINKAFVCSITSQAAYGLDELSRIFKYAENQMAYNISFGVASSDDNVLQLYIDSYFMMENRRWKSRRYVKEVRKAKDKIKRFFMYVSILLIRGYYHICYAVIPKKGRRILIMSETKDALWGNLKFIDERIKARGFEQKYKISYSYRSAAGKHQRASDMLSWIKVVTNIAAQDIIFVDDYAPVFGFFKLGKKTKLIQVWHAGEGFKSVGYSRFGKDGSPFPQGSCHKQYTHVITGSEHLIKVFQEVFAIEKEAFYPVGMPRLDGFLDAEYIKAFQKDFYLQYPSLKHKKIILFAPTYRGSEQKEAYYDYNRIDLSRIHDFCVEKGFAFLIKMHPFVKKLPVIPEAFGDCIFEFSHYPNINDLYYVTDVLITDYSSNYFEYALLKKPVVFYTYDREVYELTRGVHRSIKDCAPGKVCDTFDELMTCLERADYETDKLFTFVENNFGDYRGNAADRIIDEILLKEG